MAHVELRGPSGSPMAESLQQQDRQRAIQGGTGLRHHEEKIPSLTGEVLWRSKGAGSNVLGSGGYEPAQSA